MKNYSFKIWHLTFPAEIFFAISRQFRQFSVIWDKKKFIKISLNNIFTWHKYDNIKKKSQVSSANILIGIILLVKPHFSSPALAAFHFSVVPYIWIWREKAKKIGGKLNQAPVYWKPAGNFLSFQLQ